MDIYIKPKKKIQLIGRKIVYLKDIAEIFISGQTVGELGEVIVYQITKDEKDTYLVSVLDAVKAVTQKYPQGTVVNLGEMDILVEYFPEKKPISKALLYSKVVFICLILFIGATTAIMSFHTDTQMPKLFENYYYIFFRENKDMPWIIAIPYSLGLGFGIMLFFNHFSKYYVTQDPSPIEIEMTTYETELNDSIIDALDKDVKKGNGV